MPLGARHYLPVRADLQGQVRGERVHGHGDAAAGHPLVQARLRGPAQRVRRHQPRHPPRRLRQALQICCAHQGFGPGLKGQCHEMNNFFEGLKNQISTFCISASMVFNFHCIFIVKKNTF